MQDYSYNYFQSFREQNKVHEIAAREHLQTSCLQIAFYLASWGMLRASSFLLQKSAKYYVPLIEGIASFPSAIWDIDVDCYTEENIDTILECERMIVQAVRQDKRITITLVTKSIRFSSKVLAHIRLVESRCEGSPYSMSRTKRFLMGTRYRRLTSIVGWQHSESTQKLN
jgi:hypothetical protein